MAGQSVGRSSRFGRVDPLPSPWPDRAPLHGGRKISIPLVNVGAPLLHYPRVASAARPSLQGTRLQGTGLPGGDGAPPGGCLYCRASRHLIGQNPLEACPKGLCNCRIRLPPPDCNPASPPGTLAPITTIGDLTGEAHCNLRLRLSWTPLLGCLASGPPCEKGSLGLVGPCIVIWQAPGGRSGITTVESYLPRLGNFIESSILTLNLTRLTKPSERPVDVDGTEAA